LDGHMADRGRKGGVKDSIGEGGRGAEKGLCIARKSAPSQHVRGFNSRSGKAKEEEKEKKACQGKRGVRKESLYIEKIILSLVQESTWGEGEKGISKEVREVVLFSTARS